MMDRTRFEHLLEAYGADFNRWPAEECGSAAIYASAHAEEVAPLLAEARALDAALNHARGAEVRPELAARILAMAPRAQRGGFDRRAVLALAACAAFGVLAGYGGGLLAPPVEVDDSYFEAPFAGWGDEG